MWSGRRDQPVERARARGPVWCVGGVGACRGAIEQVEHGVDALRHALDHKEARGLDGVANMVETSQQGLRGEIAALYRAVHRPLAAVLAHGEDLNVRAKVVAEEAV